MSSLITRIKEAIFRRERPEKVNPEHVEIIVPQLKREIRLALDHGRLSRVCSVYGPLDLSDESIEAAIGEVDNADVRLRFKEPGKCTFEFSLVMQSDK